MDSPFVYVDVGMRDARQAAWRFSASATVRVAKGKCRSRSIVRLRTRRVWRLVERGVAPLVAVGAERRDAVAVEQRVLIVELRFGDEERVAPRGKEILHDDDGIHAAAALRADGIARERRADVGREQVHERTPFVCGRRSVGAQEGRRGRPARPR